MKDIKFIKHVKIVFTQNINNVYFKRYEYYLK